MTVGTVLTILILLALIVGIGYAAFWFIGEGFPAPIQVFARIIVAIVGLVALYAVASTYLPAVP